jgi:hypothetical protein
MTLFHNGTVSDTSMFEQGIYYIEHERNGTAVTAGVYTDSDYTTLASVTTPKLLWGYTELDPNGKVTMGCDAVVTWSNLTSNAHSFDIYKDYVTNPWCCGANAHDNVLTAKLNITHNSGGAMVGTMFSHSIAAPNNGREDRFMYVYADSVSVRFNLCYGGAASCGSQTRFNKADQPLYIKQTREYDSPSGDWITTAYFYSDEAMTTLVTPVSGSNPVAQQHNGYPAVYRYFIVFELYTSAGATGNTDGTFEVFSCETCPDEPESSGTNPMTVTPGTQLSGRYFVPFNNNEAGGGGNAWTGSLDYLECDECPWTGDPVAPEIDGLDHLVGETVGVVVDGAFTGTQVVSSGGTIQLTTAPDEYAYAGLMYDSKMETVDIPTDAFVKKISMIWARFHQTYEAEIGPDDSTLEPVAFEDTESGTTPYTGVIPIWYQGGWGEDQSIVIQSTEPYRFSVGGIGIDYQ